MNGQTEGQLTHIYDLFRGMDDYTINQLYHGDFSTTVTDNILSAVEVCLSTIQNDVKLRKRLYFLTVESLQNITRHEERVDPQHKGNCFFFLQGSSSVFYITSGNYIANERIHTLQSRLEVVNSLDVDSLRAYAKELMEAGDYSGRGGAGLGLIEMARKSCHKLQYAFVKFNDNVSYFYFQIKINISDNTLSEITAEDAAVFTNAQFIHQLTNKNKLGFIYSGNFSTAGQGLLSSVLKYSLNLLLTNVASSLFFDAAAILTDNIIKHGEKWKNEPEGIKKGILVMHKEQDYLIITTGNWVAKNNQKLVELQHSMGAEEPGFTPTDLLNKLGKLKVVHAAVNGQLQCKLVVTNENCDFFITQVKIGYL